MKIAGLQKVSLIDYPGKIAATLFLAGCNLNCGYCYNRWMIDASRVAEVISKKAFLSWLSKRRGMLDGVCVSGGEPTIHAELAFLLRSIKALGFKVKLDTNGTQPGQLKELLDEGLLDYVALDLKAPLDKRYEAVAGCAVDVMTIRRSMEALRAHDVMYELRTTVGPLLDECTLQDIAAEVRNVEIWFLQPFVVAEGIDPAMRDARALGADSLRAIVERLAKRAPRVRLREE